MPCYTRMKRIFLQGLLWLLLIGFGVMALSPEPGFLDFDNLPDTNFSCVGKVIGGYYADLETNCQMFHVCTIGQLDEPMDIRFLCLNGTVFDQETRVCERIDEVDCSKSEKFYSLNLELYGNTQPPILEESHETDPPIIIKSSTTTTTTTTTSTTTTRPRPKTTRLTYFTTATPSVTTPTNPKVISSHHFPVIDSSGSDIRFNPEEINISLNPGAPPNIRTKPVSFQQHSFSDNNHSNNKKVIVTTHTTVHRSESKSVRPSNSPRVIERPKLFSSTSKPSVTPSDINYSFTYHPGDDIDFPTENPQLKYHYEPNYSNLRPPQLSFLQNRQESDKIVNTYRGDIGPTTYRSHFHPILKTTHHYRDQDDDDPTEKPHRLQLPLPSLPTLTPLTFSTPAPFTLSRHIDAKRYTNDHQEHPRIIISASASVSDASGRRLNYSLGTIGTAQILGQAPASYDEYKDDDVVLDPFYHDVPKVEKRRTRKKRDASRKLKPTDVIKSEQEAIDVLRFLVDWYKEHESQSSTDTIPVVPDVSHSETISIPVAADVITEINSELSPKLDNPLIINPEGKTVSTKENINPEKEENQFLELDKNNVDFKHSALFKRKSRFNIVGDVIAVTESNIRNHTEDVIERELVSTTTKYSGKEGDDYVDDNYEPHTYKETNQTKPDNNSYIKLSQNEKLQNKQTSKEFRQKEALKEEDLEYYEQADRHSNDELKKNKTSDTNLGIDDNYETITYRQNSRTKNRQRGRQKYNRNRDINEDNSSHKTKVKQSPRLKHISDPAESDQFQEELEEDKDNGSTNKNRHAVSSKNEYDKSLNIKNYTDPNESYHQDPQELDKNEKLQDPNLAAKNVGDLKVLMKNLRDSYEYFYDDYDNIAPQNSNNVSKNSTNDQPEIYSQVKTAEGNGNSKDYLYNTNLNRKHPPQDQKRSQNQRGSYLDENLDLNLRTNKEFGNKNITEIRNNNKTLGNDYFSTTTPENQRKEIDHLYDFVDDNYEPKTYKEYDQGKENANQRKEVDHLYEYVDDNYEPNTYKEYDQGKENTTRKYQQKNYKVNEQSGENTNQNLSAAEQRIINSQYNNDNETEFSPSIEKSHSRNTVLTTPSSVKTTIEKELDTYTQENSHEMNEHKAYVDETDSDSDKKKNFGEVQSPHNHEKQGENKIESNATARNLNLHVEYDGNEIFNATFVNKPLIHDTTTQVHNTSRKLPTLKDIINLSSEENNEEDNLTVTIETNKNKTNRITDSNKDPHLTNEESDLDKELEEYLSEYYDLFPQTNSKNGTNRNISTVANEYNGTKYAPREGRTEETEAKDKITRDGKSLEASPNLGKTLLPNDSYYHVNADERKDKEQAHDNFKVDVEVSIREEINSPELQLTNINSSTESYVKIEPEIGTIQTNITSNKKFDPNVHDSQENIEKLNFSQSITEEGHKNINNNKQASSRSESHMNVNTAEHATNPNKEVPEGSSERTHQRGRKSRVRPNSRNNKRSRGNNYNNSLRNNLEKTFYEYFDGKANSQPESEINGNNISRTRSINNSRGRNNLAEDVEEKQEAASGGNDINETHINNTKGSEEISPKNETILQADRRMSINSTFGDIGDDPSIYQLLFLRNLVAINSQNNAGANDLNISNNITKKLTENLQESILNKSDQNESSTENSESVKGAHEQTHVRSRGRGRSRGFRRYYLESEAREKSSSKRRHRVSTTTSASPTASTQIALTSPAKITIFSATENDKVHVTNTEPFAKSTPALTSTENPSIENFDHHQIVSTTGIFERTVTEEPTSLKWSRSDDEDFLSYTNTKHMVLTTPISLQVPTTTSSPNAENIINEALIRGIENTGNELEEANIAVRVTPSENDERNVKYTTNYIETTTQIPTTLPKDDLREETSTRNYLTTLNADQIHYLNFALTGSTNYIETTTQTYSTPQEKVSEEELKTENYYAHLEDSQPKTTSYITELPKDDLQTENHLTTLNVYEQSERTTEITGHEIQTDDFLSTLNAYHQETTPIGKLKIHEENPHTILDSYESTARVSTDFTEPTNVVNLKEVEGEVPSTTETFPVDTQTQTIENTEKIPTTNFLYPEVTGDFSSLSTVATTTETTTEYLRSSPQTSVTQNHSVSSTTEPTLREDQTENSQLATKLEELINDVEANTKSIAAVKLTTQTVPLTVATSPPIVEQSSLTSIEVTTPSGTQSFSTEEVEHIPRSRGRTRGRTRGRVTSSSTSAIPPEIHRVRPNSRHRFQPEPASKNEELKKKRKISHETNINANDQSFKEDNIRGHIKNTPASNIENTDDIPSTDAPLYKSANPTQDGSKQRLETTPLTVYKVRRKKVTSNYIFNCFGRELDKFYSDPRDCRLFHYCTRGYTKSQLLDMKFVCESDTYFDNEKLICTKEKPLRCL